MCVGLHATDVLNIQNETQTYHEDMKGIPEYINKLDDAQKKSTRAGNPTTEPTIVLFAANAMLRTDRFPWANEIWEELPGSDRTWARQKLIYRKADIAGRVKKTAQGVQYQFGAHGAFDKEITQEGGIPQLPNKELDGYFRSLVNAATEENDILAALVKSNATLTTSNASLTATIADLQRKLAAIGKTTNPWRESTRQRKFFPNCKKEVYHYPNECYELKKNSHLRHPGWWRRLLWRCASTKYLYNNKDKGIHNPSSDLLSKHSYRPPPHTHATSNELHPIVPPPCEGSKKKPWKRRWAKKRRISHCRLGCVRGVPN